MTLEQARKHQTEYEKDLNELKQSARYKLKELKSTFYNIENFYNAKKQWY